MESVDPDNGGKNASVLCLLEAPGPRAMDFVSQENNVGQKQPNRPL